MSDGQTEPHEGDAAEVSGSGVQPYRVLARKYRPQLFEDLIGQDAMVRTLSNAFTTGRIAHAYMLTGVRGVGKTTTARLIARALNYETDAVDGPSIELAEPGSHCPAIMESRHVDVVEMDAASNTGIDDVREIIEAVRYRPASARYKVYIIDEVHMLSKAAFNGLLKTLEEPPPHVKFIFATTEIRKVPVTVLSRCQRFDLRRIDTEGLIAHLTAIAGKESVSVDPEAVALIARAAEGSVRDALSLLDQAIALCGDDIAADAVRDMLGLADRARIIDLLDAVLTGDVAKALEEFSSQCAAGADPVVALTDLAALVHWVTRLKLVPSASGDVSVSEAERTRGADMAGRLSMRVLTRLWQMLLKGIAEAQAAPNPEAAAEMMLVRMCYVSDLPAPEEVVRTLTDAPGGGDAPGRTENGAGAPSGPPPERARQSGEVAQLNVAPKPPETEPVPQEVETERKPDLAAPQSFQDIVELAGAKRDIRLKSALERGVRLVSFRHGHIEINLADGMPPRIVNDLTQRLKEWTGSRWIVSLSQDEGEKTIFEQAKEREAALLAEARSHPVVDAALKTFPGAEILSVKEAFDPGDMVDPIDGGTDEDNE